jgi:hypothetical protein
MSAVLLAPIAVDATEAARFAGRPVTVLATARDAISRNRALQGRTEPLVALVEDPAFLDGACRLVDDGADFVTALGDRLPSLPSPPRPIDELTILARPLGAGIDTVFRRTLWEQLGGFDEHQPEADFWLRALDGGARGALLEGRLPRGTDKLDAARFLARHGARIERNFVAILSARERMFLLLEGEARRRQP